VRKRENGKGQKNSHSFTLFCSDWQSLDLGVANGLVFEGFVDSLIILVIEFPVEGVDDPGGIGEVAGGIDLGILLCNRQIFFGDGNLAEFTGI
jgi:hypothetical protein